MPLKRKGKIIYHKVGSKWVIKQRCKSVKNAKAAMRLLQGISHGTIIRRRDGIKQRYHKKAYASIEGNMIKIEDLYYALDREGVHYSQMGRLVTDKDVFRPKNGYYWQIRLPMKDREPVIFNTYSGDKAQAHRYVRAIRLMQRRSGSSGYLQGLYRRKPIPYWG